MANRTVSAESLREGQIILVNGKLAFSRLAQPISGEALLKRIAEQRARGLYPTLKPHTTISITDAQVLYADPSAPTPEEIFVQESFYVSKSGQFAGHTGYGLDNTGTLLPQVLVKNEDGSGSYGQIILERDLATGLDVTLVLNIFKSKEHIKRGVGLSQVLINEELRYYGGGVDTDALAARGIIIQGPLQSVSVEDSPAAVGEPTAPAFPGQVTPEYAGLPQGTVVQNGLPLPGPEAPAAQPQQVPATAKVESDAERIARLEAELAAQRAAAANSGGNSVFDAAPDQAAAGSPWNSEQSGIHYQG